MDKDFDNNIPDFSTRKKVLKLILFLLVVSLAILVVQLFFKESLSFTQGNLAIINSFIAFSVGSKEKVDELTEILKSDGYEVISGPRTTGDGYYESCIVAIEENQIEITI